MVPYQLSEPTTFQPAPRAMPEVRPARPVMPELLNTTTMVSPRLTTTGFFFGVAFLVGVAVGVGVGVAVGVGVGCAEATRACCSGWGVVAKKAAPAMATPTTATSITRDGATTPRSSRSANRRRMTSDVESEPARLALALAGGAEPTQPPDQQRVGGERL